MNSRETSLSGRRWPWSIKRTCHECGRPAVVERETLVAYDRDLLSIRLRCNGSHTWSETVPRVDQ
jgi:hypothetical protein